MSGLFGPVAAVQGAGCLMGHSKWSEIKRPNPTPGDRPTYRAVVEPDGGPWMVSLPGIRGVRAQVDQPEEAEEAIRGAIALMLEVKPDGFDVEVTNLEEPE